MTHSELLTLVTDMLVDLNSMNYGSETEADKVQQYDEQVNRLNALRRKLSREILSTNTSSFKAHTASLKKINNDLKKTIYNATKIAETLDNLVKFIGVLEKIISTASSITSAPDIASLALAIDAINKKSALHPRMMSLRAKSESIPIESIPQAFSAEKVTELLPIEEVLYGVELTPEKLIITVATGGCTKEGSFHVEVHKGYKELLPYLVTVYRIVPDDCEDALEPMKISFSREKLGLDGAVEFILRNKIGNTSQHRLVG
jgi:hypothetical protein